MSRRFLASLTAVSLASLLLLTLTGGCSRSPAKPPADEVSDTESLPDDTALCAQLDEVIDFVEKERLLDSQVNAAWQIMHGVLAYGPGFEIEDQGETVEALRWVMAGGNMTGWVMRKGDVGLKAIVEPGTQTGQGHEDQWLSIISQCGLPSSETIVVGAQNFTVGDLVKQAMWDMYDGKEASWSLMALSYYLPMDTTWQARDGSEWTFEKLIAMEARQSIPESACGGTHRLSAMKAATRRYLAANPGATLSGGWLAADIKINELIEVARNWQQPSGAFSAHFFVRPGSSDDPTSNMYATGHTFEFLAGALDEKQLAEPWMVKAAVYLCELFHRTRDLDMECGALYHAAHGLIIYRDRRFGKRPLQQYKLEEADEEPSDEPQVETRNPEKSVSFNRAVGPLFSSATVRDLPSAA